MSFLLAVPTRNRPAMLARCLCSIAASAPGAETRVLVIDDGSTPDARAAIEATVARYRAMLPVGLCDGPGIGVAGARNRAIDAALAADAEALVFLDDDQTVPPGFVAALVAAARETGADVVKPLILWAFDPPARHMDALAPAPADGPRHGVVGHPVATNGVLIARSVYGGMGLRFDTDAGLGTGEDTLFFSRALQAGARIVVTRATHAVEHCPADKQTLRWLLARAHAVGLAEARLGLKPHGRVGLVLGGVATALAHGALALIGPPRRRVRRLMRVAKSAGRVAGALGGRAGFYRSTVGR